MDAAVESIFKWKLFLIIPVIILNVLLEKYLFVAKKTEMENP